MPEILDACCGGRMWWWDKNHPLAIYMDSVRSAASGAGTGVAATTAPPGSSTRRPSVPGKRSGTALPLREPQRAIIVPPGGNADHHGDGVYALVTEEGECIAMHICSHAVYAPGDLWERRKERQEEFADRNITEIVWLADSGISLDELRRRNEAFVEAEAPR